MTTYTRRTLLRRAGAITAAVAMAQLAVIPQTVRAQAAGNAEGIKALIFDVFGTLVDWRRGVAREAEQLLKPLGHDLDWLAFADAWRRLYMPSMREVREGREPWVKLDVLHRRMLDRVLPSFGLESLDKAVADELNLAWHKLDTWPDVVPGMNRLKEKFLLAPCSNGNISIMVDLARRNGMPWDAILGAEIARDYKPELIVYQASAEALNLRPEQVMMVAAHTGDLRFAGEAGLRTGHLARPGESGSGTGEAAPGIPVDYAATGLEDLATQLGV